MERTIQRARKISGQIRVPGERAEAIKALWLAAIGDGVSRVQHVPTGMTVHTERLRALGVAIETEGGDLTVTGVGLRGLNEPHEPLDLTGLGGEALLPMAVMAMQPTSSVLHIDADLSETARRLAGLLARTGAVLQPETDTVFRAEGTDDPGAADHPEADLDADTKLALMTAGLYAGGAEPTTVRQAASSKDRVESWLTGRGITVEPNRKDDPSLRAMIVTPGAPSALDVDLPGDLTMAMPFIVAALIVGRSELTVERVAIRGENRTFLDLLRQIKGEVEIVEADGATDLIVKGSHLKGTRVADQRARRLLDQVPLLAVLATQTEGEFIIRDVEALRRCENLDLIAHLVSLLRGLGAKVGEYPEGLVIDGSRPLKGTPVATHAQPSLAQAFAIAGLVTQGGVEIQDCDSVDAVYPGFFDTLDSITVKERT